MNLLYIRILVLKAILLISTLAISQTNTLLKRDFWKANPTLDEVKAKIKEGNDPSELNRFAFDPLVYALLEKAPMETLTFLLDQKGNDVNKITHDGRTYIFWAAYKDNLPFMEHLIDQGAVTDIIDEHGYSLLNFSAVTGQENPKLYDFIIKHGANVIAEKNNDGANALLLLLPHLNGPEMVRYFQDKGLELSSLDNQGNNAFNYTARGGNLDMLNWLIDEGVSYKVENESGTNAMHFASEGMRGHTNSLNVFQYLEKLGLDPNQTDHEGTTPLMLYVYDGKDADVVQYFVSKTKNLDQVNADGNSALMNAAKYNDETIVYMLSAQTKQINASNKKGQTALSNAVQSNSSNVVNILTKAGAKTDVVDADGNNLIYYLAQSYSPRKASDFKEKQDILENNGLELTTVQANGNTFFHLAAEKNQLGLLKKAHDLGLEVNEKNKEGMTPLHIAAMKANNDELLKYLISIGADKSIRTDFDESALQLASENELLQKKQISLEFLED